MSGICKIKQNRKELYVYNCLSESTVSQFYSLPISFSTENMIEVMSCNNVPCGSGTYIQSGGGSIVINSAGVAAAPKVWPMLRRVTFS